MSNQLGNKLSLLVKHCRPRNLAIIAITQLALYYSILMPIILAESNSPNLTTLQILLLILTTVLLAAGGYLINDIIDDPIDRVNKGLDKSILHNLGGRFALVAYWSLGAVGLLLAAYLANATELWNLFWLFPLSWMLLLLYARIFKKTPLFGNLIVSLFCAFVPGILLVAEWPKLFLAAFESTGSETGMALAILLLYILFAFLTTMIREIIKDAEDMEGDRAYDCRTLPIVWGIARTKVVVFIFALMLIITFVYFANALWQNGWWFSFGWMILVLLLPFFLVMIRLYKATEKADFTWLSQAMKLIMVGGLLLLIVFRLEVL